MDKKDLISLDSNAIMLHINKKIDVDEVLSAYKNCERHISVIVELEVLSRPAMTSSEEAEARAFLDKCVIEDITNDVKKTTVALRRMKQMKLPDAIIAATAIVLNAPILSYDPFRSTAPYKISCPGPLSLVSFKNNLTNP
jgi:predicted nucleic acid-binding protein